MKKNTVFAIIAVASLFSFSCSLPKNHEPVRQSVLRADYSTALSTLESNKTKLYTDKDQVLYSLDTGILNHYLRNYEESSKGLAEAERLIYEYFTKSVSQSVTSFLLNDTVIDYAGEDYEDIYTNLFMALNYLNNRDVDSAFVEIRRFDNKQKALTTKYEKQLAEAKTQAKNDSASMNAQIEFHNSALARYLSMIMYRSIDKLDSAEIDRKMIASAFGSQKQVYPFPVPTSIAEELDIPQSMARLNVISFFGLAPVKTEFVERLDFGNVKMKIALPLMNRQPSTVNRIQVDVKGQDGSSVGSIMLEQIESIENIALDTFNQRKALMYFKAIARSTTKAATNAALDYASKNDKVRNSEAGLALSVLSLASSVSNELTEQADLRTSRYLPGNASVGGITLVPGSYTVTVTYLDGSGYTVSTDTITDVIVEAGNINILESICLH